MKKGIILFLLISIITLAFPQISILNFQETTYDFGTIKEEDGSVIHEFKFGNNSQNNVRILDVIASCGCTTPGWSKEEIEPGGSGFIKVKYDPRNRPGPFHKSLSIAISKDGDPIVIFIKGNVTPKPQSIEEQFPVVIGQLGFKMKVLNLGRVKNNKTSEQTFTVHNFGDQEVKFHNQIESPEYIKVVFVPVSISPNENGKIIITYDAQARNDLGFVRDNISVFTNEKSDNKKSFDVYVTIDQYFPILSAEERADVPRVSFDKSIIDLGRINTGQNLESKFIITNSGKSDLEVLKIKSNCDCLLVESFVEKIKPGENYDLNILFKTEGLTGTHQKSITIWTNDPARPANRLIVKVYLNK